MVLLACLIFLAGLIYELRELPERRNSFRVVAFLVLTVGGALGAAETFRSRVELRENDIRVGRLFGEKIYPRASVAEVRWEKGSPVSLKLTDGAWADLPSTGHPNTKVAGAIRTWLNEERGPSASDPLVP